MINHLRIFWTILYRRKSEGVNLSSNLRPTANCSETSTYEGGKWIKQFIFGFPTTGILSQEGGLPRSGNNPIPAPMAALWRTSAARFQQRPRASGFRNADALWSDSMGQVSQEWLRKHLEFPDNGDIPSLPYVILMQNFASEYLRAR